MGESIGGVVGRFGEPNQHGTLTNCKNTANVWVVASGAGETDRFGTVTYASVFFVGGVCGYTNGNVINCTNGEYDSLYNTGLGTVQTSSSESIDGAAEAGRGADQVGGVVGSVRGESKTAGKYNDGDPEDPTYVRGCFNYAAVSGKVAVGGIVGQAGVYCYIEQCRNGIPGDSEEVGHVTSTRWNKPCTGGILGQGRGASVSYSANFALIENIQTGYYTAGIVGTLFIGDDYPDFEPTIYSCFNAGHIYTANRDSASEFREAGIVGQNEGYVHDCVMLYGTVPYHDDAPVGANDWGLTANLYVLTEEEMQTSYCAALLNEANDGTWDVYWYINDDGYPVLITWETPKSVTELTPELIQSATVTEQALYIGEGVEPVPTISVTLTNGRTLWQNTDFYVVPQKGACDVTRAGEEPYQASIVGLGRYSGRVDNVCSYGIGKGDLSLGSVVATSGKYALGTPSFPAELHVVIHNHQIDDSAFSYRIYDYQTSSLTDGKAHYVVYDSDGYVEFEGATELVAVSDATLTGNYVLYDRDRVKISDSAGLVYDANGNVVENTYSCIYYKKDGKRAGYVVEATARDSALKFSGSAIGSYVVTAASLKDDVKVESVCLGDTQWVWDADDLAMYATDENGNVVKGYPEVTFTGELLKPSFVLSYMGQTLTEGSDYKLVYGDPNASDNAEDANINVSKGDSHAGVTVRSADSRKFSNYLPAFFNITPAKLEDCVVSTERTTYAHTGLYVEPDITVNLNGVNLVKDRDFTVTYKNNLRSGTATYTVTALDNLSGGEVTSVSGTFKIAQGIDIGQYTIDKVKSTTYNFGAEPNVPIVIRDKDGNVVDLKRDKDYTLAYSDTTYSIGTATITLTGMGAYSGTLTTTTVIMPFNVSTDNIYNQVQVEWQDVVYGSWKPEYDSTDARYNIGTKCPVARVRFYAITNWETHELSTTPYNQMSSRTIIGNVGATYTDAAGNAVTYKTAKPGTLTATVDFSVYTSNARMYGCKGSLTHDFNYIEPVDIAREITWGTEGNLTYTGSAQTPVFGVSANGTRLVEGTDYTITYSNNTAVGLARYTVTAKEGSYYTGSYSGSFTIQPVDIKTAANIKAISAQAYTGSAVCPEPEVYVGTKLLVKDQDYTLDYLNNVEVGRASVYVMGKGNYGGRTSCDFFIADDTGKVIDESWVSPIANQSYTGSEITPHPVINDGDITLVEGRDYKLSYKNNVSIGTAQLIVSGMGDYLGEVSVDFTIERGTNLVKRVAGDTAISTASAVASVSWEEGETSEWAILARSDDFADAMSATGLAGALDAPIVLTDRYCLSDDAVKTLRTLKVSRVYIIGGTGAMPGDFESELSALGIASSRLYGAARYDTSVECAQKIAELGGSDYAIVTTSTSFRDALSASSFAYKYHVPILLQTIGTSAEERTLTDDAQDMLVKKGEFANTQVFVVGGSAAVSNLSMKFLGRDYTRIWGDNGYETSQAVAEYMVSHNLLSANTVCIATGAMSARGVDALAGAALAGRAGGVMLLVSAQPSKESENYTTIDGFLAKNARSVGKAYVLGGTAVIPDAALLRITNVLQTS